MIIIGTTDLKSTRQTGVFFCPRCMESRAFDQILVRQFLTVYFIPLIPLNKVREYIECAHCMGQFAPEFAELDADTVRETEQAKAYEAIRRVLVLIVGLDNVVTPAEVDIVREFTRTHLKCDLTEQELRDELERVHASGLDVDYIRDVAADLRDGEKDELIRFAFLAASADGALTASRTELLKELPHLIGVSETRYRRIIQQANEP